MKEIDDTQNICPYCHKNISEYVANENVLPAGVVLCEKYLIGAVLGEGGFGITYIGKNILLDITVAIKEFYPTGMVTRNSTQAYTVASISEEKARKLFSESKDIFWKEAKTLAGFNAEPGIVSVLDFFTANNTAYIVTEFLEGETLGKYLDRMGKIPFDNALCLLMPVMESLIKIHKKNLIHRDISPDNIMLVGESVKLIDFGATRQYADNHSLSVILKEGYAPVEQYSSKGNQGTWTDVYALCAVIYRCITGIVPVAASERMSADEEVQLPSELGIDLRPEVEQILMKGLALKRKDRIQTVEELIEEFTKVMNSKVEETQPTEDGIPENPESVTEQPDAVSSDNNSDESVDTLIVLPVSNMEDGETTEPENTPLPNNDNADNRLTGFINSPVAFPVSDDETETEDNHPEPETNSSQTNDNSDTNKRLTVLIDTPRDLDLSNEEESTEHTTEPVSAPEPENTPEEVSKVKYWVAAIVSVLLIGGGIFGVSRLNSGGGLQVDYSEVTESTTTTETTTTVSVSESFLLKSSLSETTTTANTTIENTTTTTIPSEKKTSSETTTASVTKKTKAKTTTTKAASQTKTATTTKASATSAKTSATTAAVTTTVQTTKKKDTTTTTAVTQAIVKPTDIKLSETSIELEVGEAKTISATITPTNATNKNVSWSSSDSNVATVENGKITAKKAGTATITAKTENGKTATCKIKVNDVTVKSLSLTEESISLVVGDKKQLNAVVTPDNAKDKTITWSSSDNSIAEVSSSGLVTAKKAGTAKITAKTTNGKTATCSVTVGIIEASSVMLNNKSYKMNVGDTVELVATVLPENAMNKTVTWSSSNTKVAKVNDGKVTALEKGETTITVKTHNGKTASCTVTVNEIEPSSVMLNNKSYKMNVGDTVELVATVLPENAMNKTVTWSSSNTKVAKVNDGKVTALEKGEATITVKTNNGKTASCAITVNEVKPTSIALDQTAYSLGIDKSITLNAVILPDNAVKTVSWSSSNSSVAMVDNYGKVTGRKIGKATITATTSNGLNAVCEITVNAEGSHSGGTWILNQEGLLKMSGSYISDGSSQWRKYSDNILSVIIESGIASIGNYAFSDCKNMVNISIPNSVTYIGNYSFSNCSSLSSVEISNTVTRIGKSAFENCVSLSSVDVGNSIDRIAPETFSGCTNLQSVTIGNSVETIWENAFNGCKTLSNVILGNNVYSIKASSFANCFSLNSITIPTNVRKIDSTAFSGCNNLTIKCYKDSAAEKFAVDNNISYEIID